MTKQFERRMAVDGLEVRDDSSGLTLTGYASTFNDPYDMGWYSETVDPAAFKRTLGQQPDVRLLINHDGLPLARTTAGTLTLDTDTRGLRVSALLDPSDPDVARLAPKMRRGDLNQMSFGFRTNEDDWSQDMSKRTLRQLDLNNGDVSVVTYPANPNASAAIRGVDGNIDAIVSALRHLEQRGGSPDDIQAILTRALGQFAAREVEAAAEEIVETLSETDLSTSEADDAAREALLALELRKQRLRLL